MEIKNFRDELGMDLDEFSLYLKIPRRTLYSWEKGERVPAPYIFELIKTKIAYDKIIKKLNEIL